MKLETTWSTWSKIIYVSTLTVCLTAVGSWVVLAQQDSGMSREAQEEMTDAAFARAAAQGGMAEIQLGKLASARGSNDEVKTFGERMVVQHGAAGDQLKATAQKEKVRLPMGISSKEQQTYDRLAKLNGSAFDRAYARKMVEDHEKDLSDFQNEANQGKDEKMQQWAAQTIPIIQEHLKQAREMLKAVSETSARQSNRSGSGR